MRLRILVISLLVAVFVTACQGPPVTQVVLVVTATPDENSTQEVLVVTATPEITVEATDSAEAVSVAETVEATSQPAPSQTATRPATATPRATNTPQPQLPALYPTDTVTQIQVAEQVFERGRMFWVQPANQIWVLVLDEELEGRGEWAIYDDTFAEGEPETDPDIEAPEGLIQPERGFGKLWRENDEVREALGWGITDEFGFVTRYEYHPRVRTEDGEVVLDENGQPIPEPGYHVVVSLGGEAFRFNEADMTWQLNTPE